jgi:hypothetical protein
MAPDTVVEGTSAGRGVGQPNLESYCHEVSRRSRVGLPIEAAALPPRVVVSPEPSP